MWKICRFQQTTQYSGLTFTCSVKIITYSYRRCDLLSMDTRNIVLWCPYGFLRAKKIQDYVLKLKNMWKKCRFQQITQYSGLAFTCSVKIIIYSCRRCDQLFMDIKNTISGVDMDFIEQKKVRLCKKNLKIINFSKYHF